MKAVFTTTGFSEAELVKSILREHEIESVLENEGGALYLIGMPTPAVPLVVRVSDEDEARALSLVELALRDAPPGPEAGGPDAPPGETPEEARAFREKVERSHEEARSAWTVAFCILFPCLIPILFIFYPAMLPAAIRKALRR